MEVVNVCRCCLAQGLHKNLTTSHVFLDKKEIYADMLNECFNIVLSSVPHSNGICDACINCLRSCLTFKHQVLQAETEFLKKLQECEGNSEAYWIEGAKPLEIKLEPKHDSDDDSDDYFLADTVKHVPEQIIKEEQKDTPKKKPVQKKKKASTPAKEKSSGDWRTHKIKNLVSRLATSINSCELPKMALKKKEIANRRRKITITQDMKLMWASPANMDKFKNKENLQTILKFSNATPFKNKTLLGFVCGYCNATFPEPMDLRKHSEVDHKKDRLNYKSMVDLIEYSVRLDVTDLICTLCDDAMENLSVLKEHLAKVHNKTIYNDIKDHILQFKLKKDVFDCAMCTATYETFKMLKQHMNKHYSNYTCLKCNTAFATKRSLNAHTTTHQEGSFKCDHCDKVFASRPKKHYHEKMKHLGARNVSNCAFCNEPFRSYYQRNQHLIKVHNTEAQYKCNVCAKTFVLKSLLMYHIKKNHLMERNCQCTECGYRFFSKKALKAHMVKHTGERNFACEVCHKSYARKYTLREHMRIHNNDRRFKCEVCAMTFVQKCSLKSHLLSNHGISMAASEITSFNP